MADLNSVVNKIVNAAKELGITAGVEEHGRERVVILELGEDFSIYVSVLCNGECDIEYAIGDENFTFKPNQLGLLKRAVDVIDKLNKELSSQGSQP